MTLPAWLTLVISFVTDFTISAGGCATTAMVATGSAEMPTMAVIVFSVLTGLIAASRRVQAMLTTPPTPPSKS